MLFAKRLERKVDGATKLLVSIENELSEVGKRNGELAELNAALLGDVMRLEREKAALEEKCEALTSRLAEKSAELAARAGAPGAPVKEDGATASELVNKWRNGEGADAWS